jgi:hypothetical protein
MTLIIRCRFQSPSDNDTTPISPGPCLYFQPECWLTSSIQSLPPLLARVSPWCIRRKHSLVHTLYLYVHRTRSPSRVSQDLLYVNACCRYVVSECYAFLCGGWMQVPPINRCIHLLQFSASIAFSPHDELCFFFQWNETPRRLVIHY